MSVLYTVWRKTAQAIHALDPPNASLDGGHSLHSRRISADRKAGAPGAGQYGSRRIAGRKYTGQRVFELMKLLQELNREEELSMVMATHAPRLAEQFDRVLTLENGRLK